MNKHFIIITVLLSLIVYNLESYGQKPPCLPPEETKVNAFIKQTQTEVSTSKEQMNTLQKDKGFDPEVSKLLKEVSTEIQVVEEKLQTLKSEKQLTTQDNTMALITERMRVVKDNLISAGAVVPAGPKSFPERCLILTLDDKGSEIAKKEGLEQKEGIIEAADNKENLVLKVTTVNGPTKTELFALDENVGAIGSKDQSMIQNVRKATSKDMVVTAWVDLESKKVMCVSSPRPLPTK